MRRATKIQKEWKKKGCPECGASMHFVDGENEEMLWCDECDVSMDTDGGYTN